MKIFLVALILVSCGKKVTSKDSGEIDDQLRSKAEIYLELSREEQGDAGFILTDKCDSLLFTGLYGAAGGDVDITAARDSRGKWHRRPISLTPCYPKHSASEISRDMFVGLLWYIWEHRRLDLAEDLLEYGEDNFWVMGKGDLSRTLFSGNLQSTLAQIIYRLGGANHFIYRNIPSEFTTTHTGFEAHLDVLHILLRGRVFGRISADEKAVLVRQGTRVPQNPLFAYGKALYTDGDQTDTVDLLLRDLFRFPQDRLPTTHDRCEPWVLQRDPGKDWQPCDLGQPAKKHPGGDLLFVEYLLRTTGGR